MFIPVIAFFIALAYLRFTPIWNRKLSSPVSEKGLLNELWAYQTTDEVCAIYLGQSRHHRVLILPATDGTSAVVCIQKCWVMYGRFQRSDSLQCSVYDQLMDARRYPGAVAQMMNGLRSTFLCMKPVSLLIQFA